MPAFKKEVALQTPAAAPSSGHPGSPSTESDAAPWRCLAQLAPVGGGYARHFAASPAHLLSHTRWDLGLNKRVPGPRDLRAAADLTQGALDPKTARRRPAREQSHRGGQTSADGNNKYSN